MADTRKTRDDDRRITDNRDPETGRALPHVWNEQASKLIVELLGYGMSQRDLVPILNRTFPSVGFSLSTLNKYYEEEREAAMAVSKHALLSRAHQMAMMQDVPKGVSKDKAYDVASQKVNFLLNCIHKVRPGSEMDLGGAAINVIISKDDAEL